MAHLRANPARARPRRDAGGARSGHHLLDDARYNDETGEAPIATGYSEIVFGELFRAAGWVRDEVLVANKLWWEFWPDQDAAGELDSSLGRMGLDLDLIYTMQPPEGLTIAVLVEQVAGSGACVGYRQLAGSRADRSGASRAVARRVIAGYGAVAVQLGARVERDDDQRLRLDELATRESALPPLIRPSDE